MHCLLVFAPTMVFIPLIHKNVFWMKTSACRDATLKNQPNEMGTTPQHIHTIPTSCAICQLCFVFVSCMHRRVVEGSGEGSARCIMHVDVYGECVMLWWLQCSCYWAWRVYSLFCMQKLWAVLNLYGMLGVLSFIAECGRYMNCLLCGKLWSEQ